ncbi:MAG: MFS transporter [Promethearchaeota archaeon]
MPFTIEEILYGLYHFSFAITSPFVSWYFFRLSGGDFFASGLIIAIPYIFLIFSTGIYGRISDIIGSKNLILTSLAFYSTSFVFYYIIHENVIFFFLAYICFNFIFSAFIPAFNRLISFYSIDERAEKFGRLGMMASTGFLIGSIIASVFINSRETYRNMFLIAAFIAFIAFLIAFKLNELRKDSSINSHSPSKIDTISTLEIPINSSMRPIFLLLTLFMFSQIANSVVISYFAIFVEDELKANVSLVAVVNSIATFLGVFATYYVGKMVKIFRKKHLVLLALGLYTILPFISYIINNSLFILCIYCIPLYAIFFVLIPVFISENSPESRRGESMGFYSSFQYIGLAIGTLVGGFFASITGLVRQNFLFGAFVGFFAILICLLFFKEPTNEISSSSSPQ